MSVIPAQSADTPLASTPFKRWMHAICGPLYRMARSGWHANREARFRRRYDRLVRSFVEQVGWQVLQGPFAGMKYVSDARSSALLPKLVGSYELELAGQIEAAVRVPYATFIDIGCAEGYYAVGMALRCPALNVMAFDSDLEARRLCEKMAQQNGVADRVKVQGMFDRESLSQLPRDARFFVICDIEGFEAELFDSTTREVWADADLVVELHDHLGIKGCERITAALSASHTVDVIDSRPRGLEHVPKQVRLSDLDGLLCVNELRVPQQWLVVRSRRHLG